MFPLLYQHEIETVQGNYDNSIGNDLQDCQCGYTDPRDNHFAQISYDYTYANTSPANRDWMRSLPSEIRFEIDGLRFLLCHGSPRQTNEFLWETATSTAFLERLADEHQADVILGTHTGIHWQRELSGGRRFINVGVLGRPENDGTTNVWYAIVDVGRQTDLVDSQHRSSASNSSRCAMITSGWLLKCVAKVCRMNSSKPFSPAGGRPASKFCRARNAAAGGSE